MCIRREILGRMRAICGVRFWSVGRVNLRFEFPALSGAQSLRDDANIIIGEEI